MARRVPLCLCTPLPSMPSMPPLLYHPRDHFPFLVYPLMEHATHFPPISTNQYTSRSHITHAHRAHCSMHPPTLFGHFCIDPRLPFWGWRAGARKGNALPTYKLCGKNLLCTGTFASIPGFCSGSERRGLKGQCTTDIRTMWIACSKVAT
ncbi:hypothetical protein B0H14DRAFT_3874125 [Mycena olivaceomarginata]|nr:hypothetical protein B0H14DRAFT_3874125 [Mycena olivaceomarginata]